MCSALSHTQESARHFIEVTWVPLHRIGQKARTVELPLPFSLPQGRIRNFSGQQDVFVFSMTAGVFLQFSRTAGYSYNFSDSSGIPGCQGAKGVEHPSGGVLRRDHRAGGGSVQEHPAGGVPSSRTTCRGWPCAGTTPLGVSALRTREHPRGGCSTLGVFCARTLPLGVSGPRTPLLVVSAQENTPAGGGFCTEHPRWGCQAREQPRWRCLRRRTPPQGVVSAQNHPAGSGFCA
ncbi:hypothetical protein Taro_018427 [Colocasia esculenta]|uniref:Uncharacterized protein n=1 Tax=Colocasia esculenta TaxID=4460 RepID=A0A843UQZ5_COLES|nr:hypothetical protein [Colocasia esculenta]